VRRFGLPEPGLRAARIASSDEEQSQATLRRSQTNARTRRAHEGSLPHGPNSRPSRTVSPVADLWLTHLREHGDSEPSVLRPAFGRFAKPVPLALSRTSSDVHAHRGWGAAVNHCLCPIFHVHCSVVNMGVPLGLGGWSLRFRNLRPYRSQHRTVDGLGGSGRLHVPAVFPAVPALGLRPRGGSSTRALRSRRDLQGATGPDHL
jgi:hypothetical protein